MAKLYFRYGTMGSAKTLNLLAVAHTYESQSKKVLILKPALDERFGKDWVRSRSGLQKEAHLLVAPDTKLNAEHLKELSCILVDEVQFLSPHFIEHLRQVSIDFDIPVLCFGLRTDFKTFSFAGSRRLLELADCVEEIKSTCQYCNKKAVYNMRLINGKGVLEGPQVLLGAEETYQPVCASCYYQKTKTVPVVETLPQLNS